jgi:aminotransferase
VAAPAPFQMAGIAALGLPASYYESIKADYSARRDTMVKVLDDNGLSTAPPQGAYYMMVDISKLGLGDDVQTARRLVQDFGVATVPGSSFFSVPELGRSTVRIAFCKKLETLEAAGERLHRLTSK